ncbi:hypothetical protein Vretifemale_768 [Volvox reticuliferus]|uniref:Homeobox domain-containing protein n=2 Tax=Volvox reticuliferus TaxID=1737510 RepID=A0A8J4C201_9CHLO|nr:hypothetical protein Vretifemale_768 [Volvox reticuliferus]
MQTQQQQDDIISCRTGHSLQDHLYKVFKCSMERRPSIQCFAYTSSGHPESGSTVGAEAQSELLHQLLESLRLSMDVLAPVKVLSAAGDRGRDDRTATPYMGGGVNAVAAAGSGCNWGGSISGVHDGDDGSNVVAVDGVPWVGYGGGGGTGCGGGSGSLKRSVCGAGAIELPSLNMSESLQSLGPEDLNKVLLGPAPAPQSAVVDAPASSDSDMRCQLNQTSAANPTNPTISTVPVAPTDVTATDIDDTVMSCSSGSAYGRTLPADYNAVTRSLYRYVPYGPHTSTTGGVTLQPQVPYVPKPNAAAVGAATSSAIAYLPYRTLDPPPYASGCSTISSGTGATGAPEPAPTFSVTASVDTQSAPLLPMASSPKQHQRRLQQQYNAVQLPGAQQLPNEYGHDEQYEDHDRYKQYTQRWYEERQYEEQRYEDYVQRQQYAQVQLYAQRQYGTPQHEQLQPEQYRHDEQYEQYEQYRRHGQYQPYERHEYECEIERNPGGTQSRRGSPTQLLVSREGATDRSRSGEVYGKARPTGAPRNKRAAEVPPTSEMEMGGDVAAVAAMEAPPPAEARVSDDERSDSRRMMSEVRHEDCEWSRQDEGMSETIEGCAAALRCLRRFTRSQVAAAAAAIDHASYLDAAVQQLDELHLQKPDVLGEAEAGPEAAAAAVVSPCEEAIAAAAAGGGAGGKVAVSEDSAMAPPSSEMRTAVRTQLERSAARSAAAKAFLAETNQVVRDLLTHMGFNAVQVENALNGSTSGFFETAANIVTMVMHLKASMFSLYVRHLETRPEDLGADSRGDGDGDSSSSAGRGGGSDGGSSHGGRGSDGGGISDCGPGSDGSDGSRYSSGSSSGRGSDGGDVSRHGGIGVIGNSGERGSGVDDGSANLSIAEAVATELQLRSGISETLLNMLEDKFKSSACHMWALSNIMNPRPPRSVKALLASYTGRSKKQVADWFTNWRARHWRPTILSMPLHQRIRLGIATARRIGFPGGPRRLSCHGDAFDVMGNGGGVDSNRTGCVGDGNFQRLLCPLSPSTTTEDEEDDGDDAMEEDLFGILYGNDPMVDEEDEEEDEEEDADANVNGHNGSDVAAPPMRGRAWLSE